MAAEKTEDWKSVAVTLPSRYWITVLALLDAGVRTTIAPQLEELQKRGARIDQLSPELKAALAGPIFARAEVVKALHEAGIMTAEANLQFGTGALMALVKKFQNEHGGDLKGE